MAEFYHQLNLLPHSVLDSLIVAEWIKCTNEKINSFLSCLSSRQSICLLPHNPATLNELSDKISIPLQQKMFWFELHPSEIFSLASLSLPQAKWPIPPELFQVSLALSNQKYFFSLLDGMLGLPPTTPSPALICGYLSGERHYESMPALREKHLSCPRIQHRFIRSPVH